MTLSYNNENATSVAHYAEVASALAEVVSASTVSVEIADAMGCMGVSSGDLYKAFIKDLPPFASIYLSDDGNIGGEPRSVIAGFYRALSQPIPADPDHLSNLLSLLAGILNALAESIGSQSPEKAESINRAKDVIVGDHILSWFPAYLLRANEVFPSSLKNWVSLALDYSSILSTQISNELGQAESVDSSVANFDIDRNDVGQLVSMLTSPGRSGLIVTLSDIEEIARELSLPLRVGRKRFVLEDLFATRSSDILVAFEFLARRQHQVFNSNLGEFPALKIWVDRASHTKELLTSLV